MTVNGSTSSPLTSGGEVVDMLKWMSDLVMEQHDPDTLDRYFHGFLHGIWAAIGIILDPPSTDTHEVVDLIVYAEQGGRHCAPPDPDE